MSTFPSSSGLLDTVVQTEKKKERWNSEEKNMIVHVMVNDMQAVQ